LDDTYQEFSIQEIHYVYGPMWHFDFSQWWGLDCVVVQFDCGLLYYHTIWSRSKICCPITKSRNIMKMGTGNCGCPLTWHHNPEPLQLQIAYCCTATKLHWSTSLKTALHICNLVNTSKGAKSTMGIRSQVNASS